MKSLIITIDGPAGAGKSTVARCLAKRLGFGYLDTGALYRVITLKALLLGIKPSHTQRLRRLIRQTQIEFLESDTFHPTHRQKNSRNVYKLDSTFRGRENKIRQLVLMDQLDVTDLIRQPWITDNVFQYAELAVVRSEMLKLQRRLAHGKKIVAEGRDLGSVVFPEAEIKFYLDASEKERARRRYKELRRLNRAIKLADVLKELRIRDRRDKTRALAPLQIPADAIYIDTTHLTIRQVVDKLYRFVRRILRT